MGTLRETNVPFKYETVKSFYFLLLTERVYRESETLAGSSSLHLKYKVMVTRLQNSERALRKVQTTRIATLHTLQIVGALTLSSPR